MTNCLPREGMEGEVIGREKHLYSIYRRCAASAGRSTRSWTSTPSASWSTRSTPATACSAPCTTCTSPCPGASRTTSRSPRPTATSRCTPPCSACTACPSRSRSAPAKWKRWPTTASPRTGCTSPATTKQPKGSHARARQWVKGILELQQRAGNSLEFIESVKIDLFPDEVYVFTPEGRIMELPKGSTAVDFAYAVHTDVGNSCIACRINRRLAPLSQAAGERLDRGNRHRPGRSAQPGLAQLRGHRQGTHAHPPCPQAAAPLGIGQPRRAPAQQGTGQLRHPPGKDPAGARPGCARRIPPGSHRRPARRHRPGQPHGLRGRPPPAQRQPRAAADEHARPRRPAGDPRHRRPGDQLRQVLHADPRRPHRRPPVGRQGHGRSPRYLPQHQRTPPHPGQVHPAVLGQGRLRRVQRRATRRAGAPARPDRPARQRVASRRRQHREDQHGRTRRPYQRGAAGGQRPRPRPPGTGDQAPAHHHAACCASPACVPDTVPARARPFRAPRLPNRKEFPSARP